MDLVSEGYANRPYTINNLKCKTCEAVANYTESDILILIYDVNDNLIRYRVKCKGGCNKFFDACESLPSIVHDRIINKVDRLMVVCNKCGEYITRATNGKFTVITQYFVFDKEVILYKFRCGHTAYLDRTSYPVITNYIVKKIIFDADPTT